ncbi:hypothetical protein A45J_0501 [hot springs metagenome]
MTKIGLLSRYGIIILTLGMIALCLDYAHGADWKLYAENQDFYFYYDMDKPDPLKLIADIFRKKIVTVWTKRVSKDERGRNYQIYTNKKLGLSVKGYENYEYTIFLKEINCSNKMSRLLSEADYTKDGNLLAKSESPYAEWKPIVPESDEEVLQKAVCVINTVNE